VIVEILISETEGVPLQIAAVLLMIKRPVIDAS
jgi:hypothetical protein